MQRHAEGHGHLWQKQAIVLNEQQDGLHLKTDKQAAKEKSCGGAKGAAGGAGVAATSSMTIAVPDSDEKPSTSGRVVAVTTGTSGTYICISDTGKN